MSRNVPDLIPDDAPVIDPEVVREEYWRHRAVRRAKLEHQRRMKRAGARFWIVLLMLVFVFGLLALTTWREIGQLFGL